MKRLLILTLILGHVAVHAELLTTPSDAIKLAYPEASTHEKKPILLSKTEAVEVQNLIKQKLDSKIFLFYLIKKEQDLIAYAGLYTAHVRSKTATFIVFIKPEGKINAIEIIAFNEPPEYIPKARWLSLFKEKSISDNLAPKESIPNLSGATLSARSAADTAKLMLAVWQVKFKQR